MALTPRQVFFGVGETDDAHEVEKIELVDLLDQYRQQIIALIADAGGLDLPNLLIRYTVTGGTANAIIATPNLDLPEAPGEALYAIQITQDNIGPVTINGKPWLTNVGNEFVAGGIRAGGIYLFLDNGDHFRSITDQDVSALVAEAEQAASDAETARDIAIGARDDAIDAREDAIAAKTQAELAALAAGAPLYPTVEDGEAGTSNGDIFLVSTAAGVQVFQNDGGTGDMLGWLGKASFKTVSDLLAFTGPLGPEGTEIEAQCFRYEVAASDATTYSLETAGGARLNARPSANGSISAAQLGALGDGSDDTAAMQKFFDVLKDGVAKVGVIPALEFSCDPLLLYDADDIEILAHGASIKRRSQVSPPQNNLLELLYCRHITIRGLRLHGNNEVLTPAEGQVHNLAQYGCSDITLDGVHSDYSLCDGFYTGRWSETRHGYERPGGVDVQNTNLITIGCRAFFSYRQGVSITSQQGWLDFGGNYSFTGKGLGGSTPLAAGVDCESNVGQPWAPSRIQLMGTIIEENTGSGFTTTTSSNDVLLTGCWIRNNGSAGVASRSTNLVIESCVIEGNGKEAYDDNITLRPAIWFSSVTTDKRLSCVIRNTTLRSNWSGGLQVQQYMDLDIKNLVIEDTYGFGVRLLPGNTFTDWARIDIDGLHIHRVYEGTAPVNPTGASYFFASGNNQIPVNIRDVTIDGTNIPGGETGVSRGLDLLSLTNVQEAKDIKVSGAFSSFSTRGLDAVRAERVSINGTFSSSLSRGTKLYGSGTYDPPNLTPGATDTGISISVPGAALGDRVEPSFSRDMQYCSLIAYVESAGTVRVALKNDSASDKNLLSGTVYVEITKA